MKLVLIPGDGVGLEIAGEVQKILDAIEDIFHLKFKVQTFQLGGMHYQSSGVMVPAGVLKACAQADAVWLGPLEEKTTDGTKIRTAILNQLTRKLALSIYYARICPVDPSVSMNPNIDPDLIVLQNHLSTTSLEAATQISAGEAISFTTTATAKSHVAQVFQYALRLKQVMSRQRLSLVLADESFQDQNPWVVCAQELAEQESVAVTFIPLSRAIFKLMHNPSELDVVITAPPFATIFSRLGSALEGGLGLSFEGYFHPEKPRLYSILHPPSTKFSGKNAANPIGAILSLAEMFFHQQQGSTGNLIRNAVRESLQSGWTTRDMGGSMGTSEIGDYICSKIQDLVDK